MEHWWLVHLEQNMPPHSRQWCRRVVNVNRALHSRQHGEAESGIQGGCFPAKSAGNDRPWARKESLWIVAIDPSTATPPPGPAGPLGSSPGLGIERCPPLIEIAGCEVDAIASDFRTLSLIVQNQTKNPQGTRQKKCGKAGGKSYGSTSLKRTVSHGGRI